MDDGRLLYPENNSFIQDRKHAIFNKDEILFNIRRQYFAVEFPRISIAIGLLVAVIFTVAGIALILGYFAMLLEALTDEFNFSDVGVFMLFVGLGLLCLYIGIHLARSIFRISKLLLPKDNGEKFYRDLVLNGKVVKGVIIFTKKINNRTVLRYKFRVGNIHRTGDYISKVEFGLQKEDTVTVLFNRYCSVLL
jgi:hypothetical protein